MVLWKAAKAVEFRARESINETGFCVTDFAVLELLLHKGPTPVNTIGKKVLITSGSMTPAIDRLEAKGYVQRRPHPTDRRVVVVHLTDEGRGVIAGAFQSHETALEDVINVLDINERQTLIALLKKLGRAAESNVNQKGTNK
jgi:MarR family 2-MHQ and catechol resistance regulon transcriptional repressor